MCEMILTAANSLSLKVITSISSYTEQLLYCSIFAVHAAYSFLAPGQAFPNDICFGSHPFFDRDVFEVLAEPRLALLIHQKKELQHDGYYSI